MEYFFPSCRIVKMSGGNALLEWEDEHGYLQRGWLPIEQLPSAEVGEAFTLSSELLASCLPEGEDLTEYLVSKVPKPEEIQDFLRRRGLWTKEDVIGNPQQLVTALRYLMGLEVSEIIARMRR